MKESIKSIIKVVSANMFILAVGIVQSLVLPVYLGPEQYGYWSMYLLYTGFAGFLLIGFADGVYLEYGGIKSEDLDKRTFLGYRKILTIYLVLIFAVLIAIALITTTFKNTADTEKQVTYLICLSAVITCDVSYYSLLYQATSRFNIYSKGHVIEKIAILIATAIIVTTKNSLCFSVILASITGKILTVIYYRFSDKAKGAISTKVDSQLFQRVKQNIVSGFSLSLSSTCAGLVTGIGRLFVQSRMGVEELGLYSLSFSISSLFAQVIAAIATVFYPLFKRTSDAVSKAYLNDINNIIAVMGVMALILYYPGRILMKILFVEYTSALNCVLYLIPIVICQARISIIYNTEYKIFRKEKYLMMCSVVSIIACLLTTYAFSCVSITKESIMASTYMSYVMWDLGMVILSNRKFDTKLRVINVDIVASCIMICANVLFGFSIISFIITVITASTICVFEQNRTLTSLKNIKNAVNVTK